MSKLSKRQKELLVEALGHCIYNGLFINCLTSEELEEAELNDDVSIADELIDTLISDYELEEEGGKLDI